MIISVYKDAEALRCVLHGLSRQTEKDFEIIVAEDGEDPCMAKACSSFSGLKVSHQTQADIGFRKALAVNRAIAAARSPYLIFLDGDCIPHRSFVRAHLENAQQGCVLAGRRLHLGPLYSKRLREDHGLLDRLESFTGLMTLVLPLHLDHVRNMELCRPSPILQKIFGGKDINIIGCNFSCFLKDMMSINGYDEALLGKGGEDDDLHWRFEGLGLRVLNRKFLLICYHLHHAALRMGVDTNVEQSKQNLAAGLFRCIDGIHKNH